ncbi:MAG: DUF1330 domain-containing protein [Desulfobacteraceae bacterium]|jgi:uncharacterized protein (DUF1330 family)
MKTIHPDMEKLPDIFSKLPMDKPIVMVNLLKFKEIAVYKDGPADYSGRKAYGYYAETLVTMLKTYGASVVYLGDVHGLLISPPDESWDEVLLVRYPSVPVFIEMVESPSYKAVVKHRTAALEDSRLIATVETAGL